MLLDAIKKVADAFRSAGMSRRGASSKKKKVTLVMAGTADYGFAIGSMLVGLERHSPGFVDDVVIYHLGIPRKDQAAMAKIRQCRFVEYKPEKLFGLPKNENYDRYSLCVFAKFEMFRHLADSRYVVWMDADILIQNDISGIIGLGDMAMTPTPASMTKELGTDRHNVPDGTQMYNTGVIVVSDKFVCDYEQFINTLYDRTLEYWESLFFQEEAILNLLFYEMKVGITPIPFEYGGFLRLFGDSLAARKYAHRNSVWKWWNDGLVYGLFPEWGENYQKWLQLGGSRYKGAKARWAFRDGGIARGDRILEAASVYEKVVDDFTGGFARYYCEKRGLRYECSGHRLTVASESDPGAYHEFYVWNFFATVKYVTPNRERYDRILAEKDLFSADYAFTFAPKGDKFVVLCRLPHDHAFYFGDNYPVCEKMFDELRKIETAF